MNPSSLKITLCFYSFAAKTVDELQKPEVRDYLMQKSTSGYGVDERKKPPDSELFNESFRRLNID